MSTSDSIQLVSNTVLLINLAPIENYKGLTNYLSEESREKMGKVNVGRILWNKGLSRLTSEKVRKYGEKERKTKKYLKEIKSGK